jgi:hypothetical protein
MKKIILGILILGLSVPATAQVYRWVDKNGTVHYSNSAPPAGVKPAIVDIDAKSGPPSADSQECHTVRCQGERMEERVRRREESEARAAASRPPPPPPARGMSFGTYLSLRKGMSEGEMFSVTGAPDLSFQDRSFKTYTWLPTPVDPFTTTVTLQRGRVSEIERVRKF